MASENETSAQSSDGNDALRSYVTQCQQQAETVVQALEQAGRSQDGELQRFFRERASELKRGVDAAKRLLEGRGGERAKAHAKEDQLADDASKASFPASDSPAY